MMLACFYIDNYKYQENILPKCNKIDGHEVEIIASRETFVDNMNLGLTNSGCYVNEDGIRVTRLKYKKDKASFWAKKIRKYEGLMNSLVEFNPDIIFCHGLQFLDLEVVITYKQTHPEIIVVADSHESYINSGRSFFSKYILHKMIYKKMIKKALPYINNIYCIGLDCIAFMKMMYHIPEDRLDLLPLGGLIDQESERQRIREEVRTKLGLGQGDMMFLHSGKMDCEKKTLELCEAFNQSYKSNMYLFIIGRFADEYREVVEEKIRINKNIIYLGWKEGKELSDYMKAADLYMQPGSPSVSAQNALCAGTALMVFPYYFYTQFFMDNVFYADSSASMCKIINMLAEEPNVLEVMRERGNRFAKEYLDYMKQSRRYVNDYITYHERK